MKLNLICILLFSFIQLKVFAQSKIEQVVLLDLENVSWNEFVQSLEKQTSFEFFYRNEWFDSINISFEKKAVTIREALDVVFLNTNFKYSIDYIGNRIFITNEVKILTDLPITFTQAVTNATLAQDSSMVEYLQEDKYDKYKTTFENKLYKIGDKSKKGVPGKATIAGYIKEANTGEPIIGATIFIENPWIGVTTDRFGYYSITLPKGQHEINYQIIGMRKTKRQVELYSDGKLDVNMMEEAISLQEVVVSWDKNDNVNSVKVGFEKIDVRSIKQIPTAMGEMDILKVTLTLPGVQTVGESSSGLNVRGGNVDQNLILFNDAVIYNPTHLFGFFSSFNPDVLQDVELYKSGIPANYGGRISSVLDINSREGNKKEFSGSGGIGIITGRLTLEGPIIKDKSSFMVSGRSTYSDWILKRIPNEDIKNSAASFYDINASVNYEVDDKNNLYLSYYRSNDRFSLNTFGNRTNYQYQNNLLSSKWKHVFNNELFNVTTATFSNYNYTISGSDNPVLAYKWMYSMSQANVKTDFNYFLNPKHEITFGLGAVYYLLNPGDYLPLGEESDVDPDILQQEKALESSIYVGDKYEITRNLTAYLGVRYSIYNSLGPAVVNEYAPNLPKDTTNSTGTLNYGPGEIVATYHGPEYRGSLRYALPYNTSIKLSYNRMRQYIHMLSNTVSVSPTDIWKLSDPHISPQVGDQVSIGLYKNWHKNTIETSVETYYKTMTDFLDYKSGAQLTLNHHIETDVVPAEGYAYGVEIMLKKPVGKLNGWMSYTYSRSLIKVDGENIEPINNGEFFSSNFDKPHDFTFVGNYKFTQRFGVSLNVTYSTGRPITIPIAKYTYNNTTRLFYSDRNKARLEDYFRIDFALNLEGNHKRKKLTHGSYTFAIYNLTGRHNPYSVFFRTEGEYIKGYKMYIFGKPIPTLTYNFKF